MSFKPRSKKGYRKIAYSKCNEPARDGQRYCKFHHAEDMRLNRLKQKIEKLYGKNT